MRRADQERNAAMRRRRQRRRPLGGLARRVVHEAVLGALEAHDLGAGGLKIVDVSGGMNGSAVPMIAKVGRPAARTRSIASRWPSDRQPSGTRIIPCRRPPVKPPATGVPASADALSAYIPPMQKPRTAHRSAPTRTVGRRPRPAARGGRRRRYRPSCPVDRDGKSSRPGKSAAHRPAVVARELGTQVVEQQVATRRCRGAARRPRRRPSGRVSSAGFRWRVDAHAASLPTPASRRG